MEEEKKEEVQITATKEAAEESLLNMETVTQIEEPKSVALENMDVAVRDSMTQDGQGGDRVIVSHEQAIHINLNTEATCSAEGHPLK